MTIIGENTQQMTGSEYYELVDSLEEHYSAFFPGAGTTCRLPSGMHWEKEEVRSRCHEVFDALMRIACLHDKFVGSLRCRGILTTQEDECTVDCSFDLTPTEIEILAELRREVEMYQKM